jgi:hypothetical protein
MPFKVWIEIEECDDEGEAINQDTDYSFALPFSSSGRVDTLQEALNLGVDMHNAVNAACPVEYVEDTSDHAKKEG